jgi:two-component sensor histidine kinase
MFKRDVHFKLSLLLTITLGLVFVVALLVIVAEITQEREQALAEAAEKARLLLNRNLATHTYFTHELKPALFEVTAPIYSDDYFDPAWMSSTYAVRQIDHYFKELSSMDYYYKEAAVNARSPANEADDYERSFLQQLNDNPTVSEQATVRWLNGVPYFVFMQRGEVMAKSCLRCHDTPNQAPAGLVGRYGPIRSFGRSEGEIVSAISIRVPLSTAYAEANASAWQMAGLSVMLVAGLFLIQVLLNKKLLFNPLARLQRQATRISTEFQHLGETIPLPFGTELRHLTAAFNRMSVKLRQERDLLEARVRERTAELEQLNQQLRQEIAERRQAEEELRRYAQRLEGLREVDQAVLAAQSPQAIAEAALGRLRRLIACDWISLSRYDAGSQQATLLAVSVNGSVEMQAGTIYRPEINLDNLKRGRQQVFENFADMPHLSSFQERLSAAGVRSSTLVPLRVQNELLGWLNLGTTHPAVLRPVELDIAQEVADSLAVALQQSQLHEQVRQDAIIKTELLNEVNHRVKNNLMAISGLLLMEQRYAPLTKCPSLAVTLDRLNQRIQGLAEVHRLLSESNWTPLPLSELVGRVIQVALNALPSDREVRVEITPTDLRVSPRRSGNLALLINELVTNTLKHALPSAGRSPMTHIRVSFAQVKETIRLEYRDSGPGYPDWVLETSQAQQRGLQGAESAQTLGLTLIRRLASEALGGSLTLANNRGAITIIQF